MLTSEQIDKAYRSETVSKLREILSDLYTSEEFGMYLALPNPRFDGKSDLEMIHEGRGDECVTVAQQLADCVYI